MGIVFHCNAGARAFCAPFLMGSDDTTSTDMTQDATKTVMADFTTALGTESNIMMMPNGDISVELDVSSIDLSSDNQCTSVKYSIFEAGSMSLTDSSTTCTNYVGDAYDPTNACLPYTASPYCFDGVLCGDANSTSTYEYDCDFATDRYSCAPGDLSGKLGMISDPSATALSVEHEGDNSLIPYTDDLIGKVMAIYCPYADSSSPVYLACAPIEEQTNDPSGVERLSFVMACIVSLIALLQ